MCCKHKPNPGRVVCPSCYAANAERKKRKRQANAKQRGTQLIGAHERAGDVAREHDFHAAAAQHYQDAFNAATVAKTPWVASDDLNRILEKLIDALSLSGEPDAANPWYDRLLTSYLAIPGNSAKMIDTMLKVAIQRWINSKTSEAVSIIEQATRLAEKIGDHTRWIRSNLTMRSFLSLLGRYDKATRILNKIRNAGKLPVSLRTVYYSQLALAAAESGQAVTAYKHLERVLLIAKEENDLYTLVSVLRNCAWSAEILGDIAIAKSYMERVLLLSRQHHFRWMVSLNCLDYARILSLIDQASSGYGYLLEALSSDARAPVLETALAEIGIPLALQMNDEETLAKCATSTALAIAFQSEQPERIGGVAGAFAKLYRARGDKKSAQTLLHRAVEAVSPTPYGWDLPLEVARQGAAVDIPQARALLEARAALPRPAVPRACLSLFDARVEQREGNLSLAHTHAQDALKRFTVLGWYTYANEARSLLPYVQETSSSNRPHSLPFTDLQSVLTTREQQIAGFVLRGLTNRAIAEELSITENTVEKHMTSIMHRLEIRSRHQLAAAIEGADHKEQTAKASGFRDAEKSAS